MPLIFNKALNLTEPEIRYAMANSKSNAEAARFVGCDISTYKRYAIRYVDEESGKNLWELHKNPSGKKLTKHFAYHPHRIDIFDVLDGKYPRYDRKKLTQRIIQECIFPEECAVCGFNERRITDDVVPLILTWKDGDLTNHRKENLEFICYNCYFLTYDDVFHKAERVNFKGY